MDKENVAYTYSEILFSHKKKDILLYATAWMKFEDLIQSEISQPGQILHYSSYMSYLK